MKTPPAMIGESAALETALERLAAAAKLDRPILIMGERGTGKELAAARLHLLSPRWDGPYLAVNCAALSESLLESELFGHEAGAFTGAVKRRIGRFERADRGTLFLDEIASASLAVQEKLLRAVEYGVFERLGGADEIEVDVRLVAAANVDLKARAEDGRFRADLLDRLTFDVVALPPLRARRDDIPLLASHFGSRLYADLVDEPGPFPGFADEALEMLMRHDWPGNVRELKNVAERAVYRWFSDSDHIGQPIAHAPIDPFDTPWRMGAELASPPAQEHAQRVEPDARPADPAPPFAAYDFKSWIDGVERDALKLALARCRHNQTRAAEHLGLTYHQLRGMLRKHALIGGGDAATVND